MTERARWVGFLTYDLQPFTEDCLFRISSAIRPAVLKAYPVIHHRNQERARIHFSPSDQTAKYIGADTASRTPEGFMSNMNWRAAWRCVHESDVVVLFGLQGATALLTVLLASITRKTLISVNQTLPLCCEQNRLWWIRKLKKWLLKRCQFHVCQTAVSKDVLISVYGVRPEKLFFAPFEAGASWFSRILERQRGQRDVIRSELDLDDKVVFLFVGNLHPFKGVRDLIDAAARIPSDAQFICVFAGPEEPRNKAGATIRYYTGLAQRLNVDHRIRFVGALEPEKLGALYCASDVVVLPSYRDTFGKVLAEGALAGKPLITTTACGSAGTLVVSGENGFVIEPGDVDRLRNAMIRLLDPSLREVMGRRSRQVVGRVCSAEAETAGFARVINVAIQTSLVGRLCQ